MAQGKLKVKSKLPANAKKSGGVSKAKSNKHNHALKKGKKFIAPKKQQQHQIAKFNKDIQKNIRNNIEAELSRKAQKVEEGRGFRLGGLNPSTSKKSN